MGTNISKTAKSMNRDKSQYMAGDGPDGSHDVKINKTTTSDNSATSDSRRSCMEVFGDQGQSSQPQSPSNKPGSDKSKNYDQNSKNNGSDVVSKDKEEQRLVDDTSPRDVKLDSDLFSENNDGMGTEGMDFFFVNFIILFFLFCSLFFVLFLCGVISFTLLIPDC